MRHIDLLPQQQIYFNQIDKNTINFIIYYTDKTQKIINAYNYN